MFFKNKRLNKKQALDLPVQKPLFIWLEIGVRDFNRAMLFYKKVFGVNIEIKYLFDKKIGVFERKNIGAGICIIENENKSYSNSFKPTFFVNIMHESIERTLSYGGKLILAPTLLRQQNSKGETLIGANLIDDQVGYIAEILDSEGNAVLLYSHY